MALARVAPSVVTIILRGPPSAERTKMAAQVHELFATAGKVVVRQMASPATPVPPPGCEVLVREQDG